MSSGRVQEAVRLSRAHPDWTLQAIGDRMFLTRERVRQLLGEAGIRLAHTVPRTRRCKEPGCTAWPGTNQTRCPTHPFRPLPRLVLICTECGCTFTRPRYQLRLGVTGNTVGPFCSNECQGRYHGKHFGWKNPDHPLYPHPSIHRAGLHKETP